MLPNLKLSILILFLVSTKIENLHAQQQHFIITPGNTLMFEKKKDLLFSIEGMKNTEVNLSRNLNARLGYSPSKYIGITAFHSNNQIANSAYENLIYQKNHLSGIDINFFHFMNFQGNGRDSWLPKSGMYINVSLGYSNGWLNNNYFTFDELDEDSWRQTATTTLHLHKGHIQYDLQYLIFNTLKIGASYRLGQVNYYKGIFTGQGNNITHQRQYTSAIMSKNSTSFKEYSIIVKLKLKFLELHFQKTVGEAKRMGQKFDRNDVGITLDLGAFKNKFSKKKKKRK